MPLSPRDRPVAEAACPDFFRGRSREKWVRAVEEYMNAEGSTVQQAIDALKRTLYTPPVQRGNLTRA